MTQILALAKECFVRRRFKRALYLSLHSLETELKNTGGSDGTDDTCQWDAVDDEKNIEDRLQWIGDQVAVHHSWRKNNCSSNTRKDKKKTNKKRGASDESGDEENNEMKRVEAHVMLMIQSLFEMERHTEACTVIPICFGSTRNAPTSLRRAQIDLLSAVGQFAEAEKDVQDLAKGKDVSRNEIEKIRQRIKNRMKRQEEEKKKQLEKLQEEKLQEEKLQELRRRDRTALSGGWAQIEQLQREADKPTVAHPQQHSPDKDYWQKLHGILTYILRLFSYNLRIWLLVSLLLVVLLVAFLPSTALPMGSLVSRAKRSITELLQVAFTMH